jgi:hypothetical protein
MESTVTVNLAASDYIGVGALHSSAGAPATSAG